ncbi:hypothetical protein [Chitinophaga sp. sic0106]|uniref:hypothetical protein n=1 Tax=Chitinophaga sp. sic0106 TaxID=2854785 RepID=UPI001C48CC51|nr:hypothetical protein [Chitinophaga sp. sic0106]MBV7532861.1 hypothetical protein [Chitinophaga sp. sic0106]
MTSIKNILEDKGPLLSGELIEILILEHGISNEAARKRISRMNTPVHKIKGFFTENQTFCYLSTQYKQDIYFEGLRNAFRSSAKRIYSIILALENHHGYLHKEQLAAYSFSPVLALKGHKRFDVLIKNLLTMNVLKEENDYYIINNQMALIEPNHSQYKAIAVTQKFLLDQFSEWTRNIGLGSYNTGKIYSDFGNFKWGFTSISYSIGISNFKDGKKSAGFIVADVILGNSLSLHDVDFFLQKISILQQMKSLPKFIPFLIVDSLSAEALSKLKEKGVIIGFVNELFGKGFTELLKSLINTIAHAGAILKTNPEGFLNLMDKIDGLVQGKTNNLRGDLFELAVGFYHSRFCQSIDIGKLINVEGNRRELDVFAIYADKIIVAECKGYKRKASLAEVEKWTSDKIPLIRKWISSQPTFNNKDLVFEFWSTGGFEDDALHKIGTLIKVKKYTLHFYAEKEILDKGKSLSMPRFNETLNQYFFKESL